MVRLYLINPKNTVLSLSDPRQRWLNRWRTWKPLGLLHVAAATPSEWMVRIIDENMRMQDFTAMPRPDLVGLTAFASQASRAYELASEFRARGVPTVMGGIHATMRVEEALEHVDAVVTGEGEEIWPTVLKAAQGGSLQRVYRGGLADISGIPPARHELLSFGYLMGSIQTTRGCPLDCRFCSVSAFNGRRYRQRPIADVIGELTRIREKYLLIVDDNLIGTSREHIARAKKLFRAMIDSNVNKRWIGQVTINMADDEELLTLAARSGCFGLFIGFESPAPEGLRELSKIINLRGDRDFSRSCRAIRRHGIGVTGSFIMGLDVDTTGIGGRIASAATAYGVDLLNLLFLTPLPGSRLWADLESEGRIAASAFPHDWKYYTLGLPVATHRHLSWRRILFEYRSCMRTFYSIPSILRRICTMPLRSNPVFSLTTALLANLIYRRSFRSDRAIFRTYDVRRGRSMDEDAPHGDPP